MYAVSYSKRLNCRMFNAGKGFQPALFLCTGCWRDYAVTLSPVGGKFTIQDVFLVSAGVLSHPNPAPPRHPQGVRDSILKPSFLHSFRKEPFSPPPR